MKIYDHKKIEKKWQKFWEQKKFYRAKDFDKKKKFYALVEFPYPSGDGLHVGHVRSYSALDAIARQKRMAGQNVLYPIGFDAFGLPTENFAIKNKIHPRVATDRNIKTFTRQLKALGISFDWPRAVDTTDPKYYKWTQWIFLQMYKAGMAYRAEIPINWCPKCKTGLANEEVVNGRHERCGTLVEKKIMKQWVIKITKYADRLIEDLKLVDYPERVKTQQINWIGRSEGAEIEFPIVIPEATNRHQAARAIRDPARGFQQDTVQSGMTQKIKPNFILLHGKGGRSNQNALPWLKKELESQGYKVEVPDLPNYEAPNDEEQAEYIRKHYKIDEQTVIVGFSSGGIVALRLLESGIKAAKVVLVATPLSGRFLDKKSRPTVSAALKKDFDFKKIKTQADNFLVLSDTHDYVVPTGDGQKLSRLLDAPLIEARAKEPHFLSLEEPAVLEALIHNSPGPSLILREGGEFIKVFTTRPDTLFGATYLVVAPEHEIIKNFQFSIFNFQEVKNYIEAAKKKTEIARTAEEKDPSTGSGQAKTGVELKGIKAIHPLTGEKLPVWVADYVLASYGTGAIMAVPAHDERDFAFAKKYDLPITQVIAPEMGIKRANEERRDGGCSVVFDPKTQKYAFYRAGNGRLGLFSGGVDDGEDLQAGVMREVTEESGLYDFGHIEKIGTIFAHFYNPFKKVNRFTSTTCFLSVLKSAATKDQHLEAHEDFKVEWHTPSEALKIWGHVNTDHGFDHWIWYLKQSVGRAIELGYDKTSDRNLFKHTAYTGEGIMINSAGYNNLSSTEGKKKITQELEKKMAGKKSITYKLRDWIFSRQHYWGEPIPLIFCENCKKLTENLKSQIPNPKQIPNRKFSKGEMENPGWIAVSEKDLPVELPKVKNYEPTQTGESPLAVIKKFVQTKCPVCGKAARRETDTMPNWAGSNWYFLRYLDPKNSKAFADRKKINYWMPVDVYNGGMEHTTLHLLYSRFIYKFLFDQGLVPGPEPYAKRTSHGIILAEDGRKMSKSFGNVVNPDEIVGEYGADALRMYEMFIAPFEQMVPWDARGVVGVRRFLERLWRCFIAVGEDGQRTDEVADGPGLDKLINKLIKKVTQDLKEMKFNTAVSAFMETLNQFEKLPSLSKDIAEKYLLLLAPFAPYISEELWQKLGHKTSIHLESWPAWDESKIVEDTVKYAVAVNGKMRDLLEVPVNMLQNEIENQALNSPKVEIHLKDKTIVRTVFVPGKMVNFVVK